MDGDESFQDDYVTWETLSVHNVAAEEEVANISEVAGCSMSYSLDETSENMDAFTFGLEGGLHSDKDEEEMSLGPVTVTSQEYEISDDPIRVAKNVIMATDRNCIVKENIANSASSSLQEEQSFLKCTRVRNVCDSTQSCLLPSKQKNVSQSKKPKVKIVTVNKSSSNKNTMSFEKIKNVEVVDNTLNSSAKVYVINNGKLVEKTLPSTSSKNMVKKCSLNKECHSSRYLEDMKDNKLLQSLDDAKGCEDKNKKKIDAMSCISFVNHSAIKIGSVLNNDVNQENFETSKSSNVANTDSYFTADIFPENGDCINQIKRTTTIPSICKEDNLLQNVKLLSTKEEIVLPEPVVILEQNIHIMDSVGDINVVNCPDLIFTSENAQSNEDISGLSSEGMSIPGDMVSVFEVSANTVLKSYEEQTSNNALIQSETNVNVQSTDSVQSSDFVQTRDFVQSTAYVQSSDSVQAADTNCDLLLQPESFTTMPRESTSVIQSVHLPINNIVPLSQDPGSLSSVYPKNSVETVDNGEDAKIMMTKGQYYIQRKQRHNNGYVMVLTPLTTEMMMPLLPMNRSDMDQESISDGSSFVEPDVHFNVCAESTVRTTPSRSETEAEKRERVRLAKRALRMDPNYRARESAKSKIRMQKVRMDPEYREKERMKDKLRRAKSRKQNVTLRAREKDRDKAYQYYKRLQRNIHGAVMPVFLDEEVSCEINEDVVVTATVDEETDDVESSLSL